MNTGSRHNIAAIVGARIRQARREQGLTQEQLAAPTFTKGYVSALERGSVRPSLKALEHLASRLGLPLSHFVIGVELEAGPGQGSPVAAMLREPELEALQEDLNYQYNYARMLIRSGAEAGIEEALTLIQSAEQSAAFYSKKLPARLLYRPHFLRGLAYLQRSQPELARPHLEHALETADSDDHALTIVRNMLGVALYLAEQPSSALHHHLQCLYSIEKGNVKDLSLRLSILHNLANDYWALRDVTQAISTYRQALPLVEDLNGVERQASLFWALAVAYRAANDWSLAKLYATRALHIYETLDDVTGAASVYLHLAELLVRDGRYDEAHEALTKAEGMLETTGDQVLLSNLHYDYADLYRKKGELESASEHAARSLSLIKGVTGESGELEASDSARVGGINVSGHPPINVTTAYVEALHVAALVEEERGQRDEADALFGKAQQLAQGAGLAELTHMLAFAYGGILSARGEYEKASMQFRIAAESGASNPRPRT